MVAPINVIKGWCVSQAFCWWWWLLGSLSPLSLCLSLLLPMTPGSRVDWRTGRGGGDGAGMVVVVVAVVVAPLHAGHHCAIGGATPEGVVVVRDRYIAL